MATPVRNERHSFLTGGARYRRILQSSRCLAQSLTEEINLQSTNLLNLMNHGPIVVEMKVLCEPWRVRFTNVTAISQVGINFARKTTTHQSLHTQPCRARCSKHAEPFRVSRVRPLTSKQSQMQSCAVVYSEREVEFPVRTFDASL